MMFEENRMDGHFTADKIHFGLISSQVVAYRLVYILLLLKMGPVILHRTLYLAVEHLYRSKLD